MNEIKNTVFGATSSHVFKGDESYKVSVPKIHTPKKKLVNFR